MGSKRSVRTKPGESPCSVALRHGLDDCDRLEVHSGLIFRTDETLPEGTHFLVPEPESKLEEAITEKLNSFVLTQRQPRIDFIQDRNRGYLNHNDCAQDPLVRELAITNYVADRGGNGCVPDNFPKATFYGWNADGSEDPDHFKVQVVDNGVPETVDVIEVTLFAQMPSYRKKGVGGAVTRMERDPGKYARPDQAERKLLNVKCKRVGTTAFFRSPYLRLVTFESDKARRPDQTLLVTDYYRSNFTSERVRNLTEILHQRIEAHYKIPSCPHRKCGVSCFANLRNEGVIELAIHVAGNPGSAADRKLLEATRELIYTWTRRIYAAAGVRIEIRKLHLTPLPENVLFVGDSALAHRGMPASGQNTEGKRSQIEFRVDGELITLPLTAGELPDRVAARIDSAISAHPKLAGYTTIVHRADLLRFPDPKATAPRDVLVFRPANKGPAQVSRALSTDVERTSAGSTTGALEVESIGGPKWWRSEHGDFLVSDVIAESNKQERALRWNHFEPDALNLYVVPARRLMPEPVAGENPAAMGRLGSFGSLKTTLGPIVYVGHDGLFVDKSAIAHEIGHVLMHCFHADAPLKDAPGSGNPAPTVSELLEANEDRSDAHDSARHFSDAPIEAEYEVIEANATSATRVLNGRRQLPFQGASGMETPVSRLLFFARHYGLLQNRDWIRVEPGRPAETESQTGAAEAA